MAVGGNMSHRHRDRPLLLNGHRSRDFVMALDSRAGYLHEAVPHHNRFSDSASLHSAENGLPFLFVHSTTCLHVVVASPVGGPRGSERAYRIFYKQSQSKLFY